MVAVVEHLEISLRLKAIFSCFETCENQCYVLIDMALIHY